MPRRSPAEWLALCTENNKLQISLRRHIHHVDEYVVKIELAPDEPDAYGHLNDERVTRLMSENAKAATELVARYTSIPVPEFVEDGYLEDNGSKKYFSVWKYIIGLSLEDEWATLSMGTKKRIMDQLHGYTLQLKTIPNPFPAQFAVGTLCSTHELLDYPGPISGRGQATFWRNNGPFETVHAYKEKVSVLYDWEPGFSESVDPVFDHMDWFMCNILIDNARENVVAVLDWEKAGFIPDPQVSFLAGADDGVQARYYPWLTLFNPR
jgi:hypothetical protein